MRRLLLLFLFILAEKSIVQAQSSGAIEIPLVPPSDTSLVNPQRSSGTESISCYYDPVANEVLIDNISNPNNLIAEIYYYSTMFLIQEDIASYSSSHIPIKGLSGYYTIMIYTDITY